MQHKGSLGGSPSGLLDVHMSVHLAGHCPLSGFPQPCTIALVLDLCLLQLLLCANRLFQLLHVVVVVPAEKWQFN